MTNRKIRPTFTREVVMQCNKGKRRLPLLVRGFAALCAALAVAAAGGASGAPPETVLHSFTGSDGANPNAGLIADSSGNLYGTTFNGGASGSGGCMISGCGVVFKLSPDGTETVLHSFRCLYRRCPYGANPNAGLIADSSGNLYGATVHGGGSGCAGYGCGVVFKLSPTGTEKVLYSFTGGSDGANPDAVLIADSAGNLYGTTYGGGASGAGVVFKLSPDGT